MGFFSWLIVGLIAGALAKLILPGKQGGGWIATLILGVVGAAVGALIGMALGVDTINGIGDIWTWVWAIIGSIIVLVVWGFITRGRNRTSA